MVRTHMKKQETPKIESKEVSQKSYKTYYVIAGVVIIALLGMYLYGQDEKMNQVNNQVTQPQNLDEVVAKVNGRDVTREDVERTRSILLAQTGQQIDDHTAIERAISEELMLEAAEKENIMVTTQEAEAELEALASEKGISMDELKERSDDAGSDYTTELEVYREQLIIGELLAEELPTTEISTDEAKGFYEANKEALFQEGQVQPFEQVETELKQALAQQKFQTTMAAYLAELRANADIEYLN